MAEQNFSVSKDENNIYHFDGEISIHDLEAFKDFLEESHKDCLELILNFDKVKFIDTAAIQLLVVFKKWLEPGVKLRLSSLSGEVENILALCGLKTALE